MLGDNVCIGGGSDTITNNGTVNTINAEEGDDLVNIRFRSTVNQIILGGEDPGDTDFDVIRFTDLTQAVADNIAQQCPDPDAGCTVTVGAFTYNLAEFENLRFFLLAVADAVADVLENSGVTIRRPVVICDDGVVKVIRDENNNQWVFSGFNLLPQDGFLVALLPFDQLFPGKVFSNPNAPSEGQGWTAVLDNRLHTRVFDAAGNLVSDRCLYRDEPNEALTAQYGNN
jgi:hypothetical protein